MCIFVRERDNRGAGCVEGRRSGLELCQGVVGSEGKC